MTGGTGAGNHMWNIVTIGGVSYLVDVTNSEDGTVGQGGELFLVGGTKDTNGVYTYIIDAYNTISYQYDAETNNSGLDSVLDLSETDYTVTDTDNTGNSGETESPEDAVELTQAMINEAGSAYTVTQDAFTDSEKPLILPENFVLTVSNGAILTIGTQIIVSKGASVVFETGTGYGYTEGGMTPFFVYVNRGASVEGVAENQHIMAQYLAADTAELKSALTAAAEDGYYNPTVKTDGNITITLTDDVTVPEDVTLVMKDVRGTQKIVVPQGVTLVNNGTVMVAEKGILEIQKGGTVANNNTIEVTGPDVNAGQIQNLGSITGNAVTYNVENVANTSAADILTYMGDYIKYNSSATQYNLTTDVLVDGYALFASGNTEVLDITTVTDFSGQSLHTNGIPLYVAKGTTLNLKGNIVIDGNSTVRIDGTLNVLGELTVAEGSSLIVNGAMQHQGATVAVQGDVVIASDASLEISNGAVALQGNASLTMGDEASLTKYSTLCLVAELKRYEGSTVSKQVELVGVSNEKIFASILPGDDASLREAIATLSVGGYAGYEVSIGQSITLAEDLTIPENSNLRIRGDNAQLEVPANVTLTNKGSVSVQNAGQMLIAKDGTVRNYKTVAVMSNGTIVNNGSFINIEDAVLSGQDDAENGYDFFQGNDPVTETLKKVTLTFMDGETTTTKEYTVGNHAEELPEPQNTGVNEFFVGWFANADGTGDQIRLETVITETMATEYHACYAAATARLGEDGMAYATLEMAIKAAAKVKDDDQRPAVILLKNATITGTIDVTVPIFLHTNGNADITVSAGAGVDTMFQIGQNGFLLLNDVCMNNDNAGGTVFELTANNSGVLLGGCQITADKAAIHVAQNVEFAGGVDANGDEIRTIQVYGGGLEAETAILIDGSNTRTVIAGEDSPSLKSNKAGSGVIVLNGKDNKVEMHSGGLMNEAEDGLAFTMAEGCEILMAGAYNGYDYTPHHPNPDYRTVPNAGAVARVDISYFGSLQDAFDYAASVEPYDNVGEDYRIQIELLEDVTVSSDLTLNGTVYPVELLGDHTITVGGGATLYLHTPTYLNGSKIILKAHTFEEDGETISVAGGTLHLASMIDIRNGLLYAEDLRKAIWIENDDSWINGLVGHSGLKYHLAARWLSWDSDNNCYFEDLSNDLNYFPGVTAMSDAALVFYLMTWDDENLSWNYEPVMPNNNGSTAYKITKLNASEIGSAEGNGDYFVRVTASGSLDGSLETMAVEKNGVKMVFDYEIYDRQFGFFTTPEPAVDTIISNGNLQLDANADENVFYAVMVNPDEFDLKSFGWDVFTYDQDYNSYVTDGEFLSMTRVSGKEGVIRFEVDPEFVRMTQHLYRNFNVRVYYHLQHETEGWSQESDMDVWVQPAELSDENAVRFEIEDVKYAAYPSGQILAKKPVFDEFGNYMHHDWAPGKLPAGVSYDYITNTLTLNNAELDYLYLDGRMETENVGGVNVQMGLPGGKLNLEVKGNSAIFNGYRSALELDGVELNITGSGELSFNAINSPENRDGEGKNYAFHTVQMYNSGITIGGDVDVCVTVDGVGYWDDGNKAELYGIRGDGDSSLTIQDKANVLILQEYPHLESDDRNEDAGMYRGICGVKEITVTGGVLDVTNIYQENGTFNLKGGEVHLHPRGRVEIWKDDIGNDIHARIFKGMNLDNSTLNISGGVLMLERHRTDEDLTAYQACWYDGIELRGSTMNFTGGTVEMHSDLADGNAIALNSWENETVSGSELNMSGDARLVVNGLEGDNIDGTIRISEHSVANLKGGSIEATNSRLEVVGTDASTGVLNLDGAEVVGDGVALVVDGKLNMTAGSLNLHNNSVLAQNGNAVFSGGEVWLSDMETYLNGTTSITGDAAFHVQYIDPDRGNHYCAVELNGSLTVEADEDGKEPVMSINAAATGDGCFINGVFISKNGSYLQNAGHVTISSKTDYGIYSNGDVTLNGGIMDLEGAFGLGMDVVYACDDWEKVARLDNKFTMNTGMTLNVNVKEVGLCFRSKAEFLGGVTNVEAGQYAVMLINNAHSCESCGSVANTTSLTILDGMHTFTAVDTGLSIDGVVPVQMKNTEAGEPIIAIRAGSSVVTSYEPGTEFDTELIVTETGKNPEFTEMTGDDGNGNGYYTLTYVYSENETRRASEISMNMVTMLKDILMNPDSDNFDLSESVMVYGTTTLVDEAGKNVLVRVMNGGEIIVKNGATLIIPVGSTLVALNGGKITVEAGGQIINCGELVSDQGIITVADESGYVHKDYAALCNKYIFNAEGEITLSQINNIPKRYQDLAGVIANVDQLAALAEYADDDYKTLDAWTEHSLTFAENFTIPAKMNLAVDGQGTVNNAPTNMLVLVKENLTIEAGAALNLGSATLVVEGTLVNNGTIATDIHDSADILVLGSLTNSGNILLNHAHVEVQGALTNNAEHAIEINDGTTFVVGEKATMTNCGAIHVGVHKIVNAAQAESMQVIRDSYDYYAGTLTIAGTMDNYGYLRVLPMNAENSQGGVVNVNGTLNNAGDENNFGFIEHHGEMLIQGTLNNDTAILDYGIINVSGKVNNNAQLHLMEDGNSASVMLTTTVGAVIVNNGSLRNRTLTGSLNLTGADYSGTGEVGQEFFENGRLSGVTGLPIAKISLIYEGSNIKAVNSMYAYANSTGYKAARVDVNGNMTIPNGTTVTIDENDSMQLIPGANVTLEGKIVNQGLLNVVGQDGESSAAQLTVATGDGWYGEIYNEGLLKVNGVLNNYAMIENALGDIVMNGEYNAENSTIINDLIDGRMGTITGISTDIQTLWTSIVSSEEALRAFLDKRSSDGYGSGVVWVLGDMNITENLTIPDRVTVSVRSLNDSVGNLTIQKGVRLINEGRIYVDDGAKLTINGQLHISDSGHLIGRSGGVIDNNDRLMNNGHINILFGSTINNNGLINNGEATFTNAGTYNHGNQAKLQTTCAVNEYGELAVNTVAGVPKTDITLVHILDDAYPAHDESSVRSLIGMLKSETNTFGYGFAEALVNGKKLDLSHSLTIPENLTMNIYNGGSLNAGAITLTNNGTVLIVSGSLNVAEATVLNDEATGTWMGNGWTLKNGLLTVTATGELTTSPWSALKQLVTKISLNDGVTSIADGVFAGCKAGTVLIPESVNSVAAGAFDKSVTLKIYHKLEESVKGNYNYEIIHILNDNGECVVEGCEYTLRAILESDDDSEKKIEDIKNIDTDSLKKQMEKSHKHPDEHGKTVMDHLKELENNMDTSVSAEVTEGASQEIQDTFQDVSGDSIVGAVANADENVQEVKLIIGDPEQTRLEDVDDKAYNAETAVLFSMTLEGVEDASNLKVPVKITLPVPKGIDPDRLVILHYHGDGVEKLTPYISANGKTVSFFMTGFSDVHFLNEATPINITAQNVTVDYGTKPELKYTISDSNGMPMADMGFNIQLKVLDSNGSVVTDLTNLAPGEYTIQTSYTDVSGYTVTAQDAVLTVKKIPVTVKAELDKNVVKVGTAPVVTVTATDEKGNAVTELINNTYTVKQGETKFNTLTEAVANAGTYTIVPNYNKDLVGYDVTAQETTLTVENIDYVCWNVNTGVCYSDVSDGLRAATTGQTVQMLKDATAANDKNEEVLTVNAGTTFDLNGFYVETDNLLAFGVVLDSQTETGGVVINNDTSVAWTQIQPENDGYMPIYDTNTGSYKFFRGQIDSRSIKVDDSDSVRFRFRLYFDNREAYNVIANTGDFGFDAKVKLSWPGVENVDITVDVPDATIKSHAAKQYDDFGWTFYIRMYGLDALSKTGLATAQPSVVSPTGFYYESFRLEHTVS